MGTIYPRLNHHMPPDNLLLECPLPPPWRTTLEETRLLPPIDGRGVESPLREPSTKSTKHLSLFNVTHRSPFITDSRGFLLIDGRSRQPPFVCGESRQIIHAQRPVVT